MNKLKWITNVLACLMMALAALGALCTAVTQKAFDAQFYSGMSRQAVMDTLGVTDAMDISAQTNAYIGLTDEEQTAFAQEIVSFMKGDAQTLPDVLNDGERQHMLDVRALIRLAQQVGRICMTLSAGLAVVIAWTGAQEKRRCALPGLIAGALLAAACAGVCMLMMNAQGFAAMFVGLHEMLFTNDLWLMNPQTDILIRMMPQLLFERAAADVAAQALRTIAVVWGMLLAVYFLVGGMIRRNLTQRDKQ